MAVEQKFIVYPPGTNYSSFTQPGIVSQTPLSSITISLRPTTEYSFYIDWDDGTPIEYINMRTGTKEEECQIVHTYKTLDGGSTSFEDQNKTYYRKYNIRIASNKFEGLANSGHSSTFGQSFSTVRTDWENLSSRDNNGDIIFSESPFVAKSTVDGTPYTPFKQGIAGETWNSSKFYSQPPQLSSDHYKVLNINLWETLKQEPIEAYKFLYVNNHFGDRQFDYLKVFLKNDETNYRANLGPNFSIRDADKREYLSRTLQGMTFRDIGILGEYTKNSDNWLSGDLAYFINDLGEKVPLVYSWVGTQSYPGFSQACNAQLSMPSDSLIKNFKHCLNANYHFMDMRSLTSMPMIELSSSVGYSAAWKGCVSLSSFPNLSLSYLEASASPYPNYPSYIEWRHGDTPTEQQISTANAHIRSQFHYNNLSTTWYNCRNLRYFPALDFRGGPWGMLQETWTNCYRLTSFPALPSEYHNVNHFYYTWLNCSDMAAWNLDDSLSTRDVIGSVMHVSGANASFRNDADFSNNLLAQLVTLPDNSKKPLSSFLAESMRPAHSTSAVANWSICFSNCSNLIGFPPFEIARNTTTQMYAAWQNCSNMRFFPWFNAYDPILSISAISLGSNWRGCTSLTAFPALNLHTVRETVASWANCRSLVEFPLMEPLCCECLVNSWYYCENLSSFPAYKFPAGRDFSGAWQSCHALSSFPSIEVPQGRTFAGAWAPYEQGSAIKKSLRNFETKYFPNGINFTWAWKWNPYLGNFPSITATQDNPASQELSSVDWGISPSIPTTKHSIYPEYTQLGSFCSFYGAWADCVRLSSFGALCAPLTEDFVATWYKCYQLSGANSFGFVPGWIFNNMKYGDQCFHDVKLHTDTWSSILTSVSAYNGNTYVNFDGGRSLKNSSALDSVLLDLAKPVAQGGKGWTIIDGGMD